MSATALIEAIEKLDDPEGCCASDLVELFAISDRLAAYVTAAVAAFDRDEQYADDAAPSMRAWLQTRCRQAFTDAARITSTAKTLRSLPHVAQAWRDGTLGTGHLRAVTANVPKRHVERFAKIEATMVDAFAKLTVAETVDVMQKWRSAADDADPKPDPDEPPDALHVSETLDGRRVINGHLSPDNALEVEQALAHAARGEDPDTTAAQRQAQALVDIARFFNNNNTKPGGRRNRPHVTVVVSQGADGEPVGTTVAGKAVPPSKLRQWLCDADISRLLAARGKVLDYGVEIRNVPEPLWRALAARDQGCRIDGCGRTPAWCEAHHVIWADRGGPTSLDNLVLLCGYHHRLLHKNHGWTAELEPDGTLHVTDPHGHTTTTVPPLLRQTLWPPGDDDG
jgi:hypothetical protein